jgi:hypothetical protein
MVLRSLAATLIAEFLILSAGIAGERPMYGSIVGSVFDRQTKQPIPSANVVVLGSSLGASTDENGQFTISKIPSGTYHIQVSVLGYKRVEDSVTVRGGNEPVGREFPLVEEHIQLEGVQAQVGLFSHASDAPLSTRTFSNSEVKNTAGGLDDLMRAARILPGVAQAKADRTDLMVRGGASSENLYLVDNIEVPYINHFSTQGAGGGAVSIMDMDQISGSSFSSGGFGARYGDKLSSVLDIKLRDGSTDRMRAKATVSFAQLGLNVEGPLAQDGSYLLSVRKSYLDFAFKLYGFGFAPQFTDYLGKATYSLGAADKLSLMVIGATDRIKFYNDTDEKRYENSRLMFTNQDHYVAALTLRHLFSNGYGTLTVRHARSGFEYFQFSEALNPQFQSSSTENETSVRGDLVVQYSGSTELNVGAELKDLNVRSVIELIYLGKAPVSDILEENPGKAAVYGQFTTAFDNLKVTFGVRGSYFSILEHNIALAPRLSATFAFSPTTNLTMSIGQFYQSPSYIWLATNQFNRGLSPIGVNQIILGLQHVISEDLEISLEGYFKQYYNYPTSLNHPSLVMVNTGSGAGGMGEGYASFGLDSLVSCGRGFSRGIEFSMQKKMSDVPCYGMMSVSYSETRFAALDGISRPSDFDQRIILNVSGGYMMGKSWELSGRFRFYTGRPYTPFGSNGSQRNQEYNSARVGFNHQLDLRIARHWALGPAVLETYLDVQNVYNRKPTDAPYWSQRRKRVEQAPSLGIVPTVGVAIQF